VQFYNQDYVNAKLNMLLCQ